MKSLYAVKGKEFFAVHDESNTEICKIYFDGWNNSTLTMEQAMAYAELFAKSLGMLQYVNNLNEGIAEIAISLKTLFH